MFVYYWVNNMVKVNLSPNNETQGQKGGKSSMYLEELLSTIHHSRRLLNVVSAVTSIQNKVQSVL